MTDVNQEVEVQTEETAPVQLQLQDIAMCVQIIDVCSKRGAFEGPEMEAIGALRNRVAKFLEANAPAQPAPEAPEAEAPSDAVAE